MRLPKPWPLWTSVSLFAAAAVMIPLTGQRLRQPASPPRTLAELSARLSQCQPPLYVTRQSQNSPEGAMYVCTMPRSREQLCGLACDPKGVERGQWQGIVLCRMNGEMTWIEDDFIHEHWGQYGMRIGQLVFFGDPDLLQRIRAEMQSLALRRDTLW